MPEDILNRANFGLLEEPGGRWRSFGVSAIINGSIIVLLLLFAAAKIHQAQVKRDLQVLVVPIDEPKPIKIPPPKIKIVPPPPKLLAQIAPPKIEMPKPEILPPAPVKMDTPKPIPNLPPPPPKAVTPPPQPLKSLFDSSKPAEVANNKSRPVVSNFNEQTGTKSTPSHVVVAAANFNQAQDSNPNHRGVVNTAGFGAATGTTGGTSRASVAVGGSAFGVAGGVPGGTPGGTGHVVGGSGFGKPEPARAPVTMAKAEEPAFTPPVVISEPKAQYTSEAQQQHVEGEVTLQVRFLASGQVEVLRIVSGLGHGLDEQAKHVAENIRFKPAQKNGQPVDHVTLIHITFQLA